MVTWGGAVRGLVLGICVLLGACRLPPAPTQLASPEFAKLVEDQRVPTGKARVFFRQGTFEGNMRIFGPEDIKGAAELYANGAKIGGVNYGEYIARDIQPGHYTFMWKSGWNFEDGLESSPTAVDLTAGQTIYLTANLYQQTNLAPVFGPTNVYSSSLSMCVVKSCQSDFKNLKLVVVTQ